MAYPHDHMYPPHPQYQTTSFDQYTPYYGFAPIPQFHGGYHQQQPPAPGFDLQATLQQILQAQANSTKQEAQLFSDIKTKLDSSYNDFNSRLEELNSGVHHLECNIASTSSSNPLGPQSGKSIHYPRAFAKVHAVTIDTEREIPTSQESSSITEDSDVQIGEGPYEVLSSNVQLGQHDSTSGTESPQLGLDNSSYVSESPLLGEQTRPCDEIKPTDAPTLVKEDLGPLPYLAKLPFPGRFKQEIMEHCQAQADKFIEGIGTTMPLRKAYNYLPPGNEYLKSLVLKRIEEAESLAKEEEEAKAIIQEKITPRKLEDPGSFTLPCSLGDSTFHNSLCDLGAAVSLMPLSTANKLEPCEYKPCNLSLMLADGTVRLPHGLLEDVPVKVGNTIVPTDFVILEMDKEPEDPLILGRPFLATVGAVIDVRKGSIELNFDRGKGFKMKFDIKDAVKKPTIEGHTFSCEKMEQLAEEGQSQSALNRNEFFENWIKKGKERTLEPLYEPP